MYKWTKLMNPSRNRAFYGTLLFFIIIPVCHAGLVNRTIDDSYGDSVADFLPIYQPASIWDQGCSGCYIQPETMKAFDGTWSTPAQDYRPDLPNVNLHNVNVTLRFTGVAVWVFFILANAGVHGNITTNTQVNVTLDGNYAGSFSHYPDMSVQGMTYNATIFSQNGLDNILHELVIWTNDYTNNSFFTFDWAIYTVDTNAPSSQSISSSTTTFSSTTDLSPTASISPTPIPQHSSSKIGVVVGCTLGGLAVIALILVFLVRRLRRAPPVQLGNGNAEEILDIDVPSHHQPYYKREMPVQVHEPTQSKAARLREERQRELDERIRSAQHELDLRSLRNARFANNTGDLSTAGPSRPSPELALLRNEMQQLRDQMDYLQAQRESDWALGLSDELPPAYTQLSNDVQ